MTLATPIAEELNNCGSFSRVVILPGCCVHKGSLKNSTVIHNCEFSIQRYHILIRYPNEKKLNNSSQYNVINFKLLLCCTFLLVDLFVLYFTISMYIVRLYLLYIICVPTIYHHFLIIIVIIIIIIMLPHGPKTPVMTHIDCKHLSGPSGTIFKGSFPPRTLATIKTLEVNKQ